MNEQSVLKSMHSGSHAQESSRERLTAILQNMPEWEDKSDQERLGFVGDAVTLARDLDDAHALGKLLIVLSEIHFRRNEYPRSEEHTSELQSL